MIALASTQEGDMRMDWADPVNLHLSGRDAGTSCLLFALEVAVYSRVM